MNQEYTLGYQLGELTMGRILILANIDVGLYKFRRELIEELVKDHEVFISLPPGDFISKLEELGCKFIRTSISRRGTNPITDFKLFLNYRRMINKIRPDIVLTYTIKPNVYGGLACRLANVPLLANITGLGSAVENKGLLQKLTLLLYKVSLKRAKCVFFQNKENKEFFYKHNIVDGNDRLIAGSGVNLDYYSLIKYPSKEKINFLFIGRVMKEKGIDHYLDAAYHIKKKYSNTVFHILGFCEEKYEEKIMEMQKQNIIKYHGMQSDVREFHKISHCTIHPTFYPEGMSNVLLESIACGRPIITTNRAGCREVVNDGVNGFVTRQQDSQDLINKIEKFIKLDYNEKVLMGREGRKKAEKEFDRLLVVDAYINEINSSINKY